MRRRLDQEMVRRELVDSRARAKALIEEGNVRVGGAPTVNAARMVDAGEPIQLVGPPARYVGRGGEKLEAALGRFDIDVTGKRALDVGASTGGFTDCLLQHGAMSVVALDVGTAQLHERLRADDRVDVREKTNIRHVTIDDFDSQPFRIVTVDVSFISLRTIAGKIVDELVGPDADVVTLVKPQFEAGRAEVSKGKGVVSDPEVWRRVLDEVVSAMSDLGAATMDIMVSPLLGAEGNVEFLAHWRAHNDAGVAESVDLGTVIAEAQAKRGI